MFGVIVAELVIGTLARLIRPGRQRLGTLAALVLGLVNSVFGGTIANLLGTGEIWRLNVLDFVVAVIASILLIAGAEATLASHAHRTTR